MRIFIVVFVSGRLFAVYKSLPPALTDDRQLGKMSRFTSEIVVSPLFTPPEQPVRVPVVHFGMLAFYLVVIKRSYNHYRKILCKLDALVFYRGFLKNKQYEAAEVKRMQCR